MRDALIYFGFTIVGLVIGWRVRGRVDSNMEAACMARMLGPEPDDVRKKFMDRAMDIPLPKHRRTQK